QNAKQIRASVITKWLKTYNLREVQYLAGHRYISSTEGYQQNDMEGLKEEIQQFHRIINRIQNEIVNFEKTLANHGYSTVKRRITSICRPWRQKALTHDA